VINNVLELVQRSEALCIGWIACSHMDEPVAIGPQRGTGHRHAVDGLDQDGRNKVIEASCDLVEVAWQ